MLRSGRLGWFVRFAGLALAATVAESCSTPSPSPPPPAPALDAVQLDLAAYRGKVVWITFFTNDC